MKMLSLSMLAFMAAAHVSQAQVCFNSPLNTYALGGYHGDVASADIDQDSNLDLIAPNRVTGQVQIFKSTGLDANGAPIFSTTIGNHPVGSAPLRVFVADFNHDNKQDIASTNSGSGSISVLINDGSGNMTKTDFNVGNTPDGITGGLFNADSHIDLAVANFDGRSITIWYGNGTGGFINPQTISTAPYHPSAIALGDFNDDGKSDLVTALVNANGNGHYAFLRGNGTGFDSPQLQDYYPVNNGTNSNTIISDIDTADFNNDGIVDAVMTFWSSTTSVYVLKGNKAAFPSGNHVSFPLNTNARPAGVACADYNGDGNADMAVVLTSSVGGYRDSIKIFSGNGEFSFPASKTYTSGSYSKAMAIHAADFNHDGKPDLTTANDINPSGGVYFDAYVLINKTPYFSIDGDLKLCGLPPQTTTLTASSNDSLSYTWKVGSTSSNGASFNLLAAAPNTYFSVLGSDVFGCDNLSFGKVVITTVETSVTLNNGVLNAAAANSTFQWLGCALPSDTLLLGATLQSYTPAVSGDYSVQVTFNGCIDTSDCHSVIITVIPPDTTLSVSDLDAGGNEPIIYPNPSQGQFNIEMFYPAQKYNSIAVIDMLGHVLQTFPSAGEQKIIPMNVNLPSGIYYLRVEMDKQTYLKKIIIQ